MTTGEGLLAACEERVGDTDQLRVSADWFEENGHVSLGAALRWMAKWNKRPYKNPKATGTHPWMWTCFGGLCGPRFQCGTDHALPRALCRRMGFHEWRCHETFEDAVLALASALRAGDVDCVGDPEQVDEL